MTPHPARRPRIIAAMIGLPALIATIVICAVEGWHLARPQSEIFAAPFVYSLADAIQRNDVDRAYSFIRHGQDPRQPLAVRDPMLTGGRVIRVSPLLWAVATRRPDAVRMLLGFGAPWDAPARADALCLAEAIGDQDIAALLMRLGARPDERCKNRPRAEAPLLSFAVDAGSVPPTAPDPPG